MTDSVNEGMVQDHETTQEQTASRVSTRDEERGDSRKSTTYMAELAPSNKDLSPSIEAGQGREEVAASTHHENTTKRKIVVNPVEHKVLLYQVPLLCVPQLRTTMWKQMQIL